MPKIYIIIDGEEPAKDCIWEVCTSKESAELSKKRLLEYSVDKSRVVYIVEEELNTDNLKKYWE